MKKLILSAVSALFVAGVSAQCPPSDSTFMGSGNVNDVFYSLTDGAGAGSGVVGVESNTSWHLAFSVMPAEFPANPANGVSIRVNSTLGENPQAGMSGTTLVRMTGNGWSNWHSLDTTGLSTMPELLDSDSTWDLSAFTSGYSPANPFNFMFGTYNQTSNNIVGSTVYVLYNQSAGWYKKIFINELVKDTLWKFTISNIDNSDSNYVEINKKDYLHKNFVYYNVNSNTVLDREPDNRTWDLVWTKYKTVVTQGQITIPYPVTGILHNRKVKTAQNEGRKCNEVWMINKSATAEDNISTIGYDWKNFVGGNYVMTDTFVYFVEALDGKTYKLSFNSYAGGALGKTVISFYEADLSVQDAETSSKIAYYPNPAGNELNIQTEELVGLVNIQNMSGQTVLNTSESSHIDISSLTSGMYFVSVRTDNTTYTFKFIKN